MRKLFVVMVVAFALAGCKDSSFRGRMLADERMDQVVDLAKEIASQGFNAGSGYSQVWIRDFNTFIELSMDVMPDSTIRENLNMFYAFQGARGEIQDGFVERGMGDEDDNYIEFCDEYPYAPKEYVAYKNTVETDQESSLVQAVAKYVRKSGNRAYLGENVYGCTVYEHLSRSMEFLLNCKMETSYGLITGATTVDWGDVQPEHSWGVDLDGNTHYCIDIYDNAMFILALNDMAEMAPDQEIAQKWEKLAASVKDNVRKHLWDSEKQKFRPHVYLNGSPFPEDFDEDAMFYQGGTAVAILAGILDESEVRASLQHMLDCQKKAHAQTIGITVYPTYPAGTFGNEIMYPYGYQNGGDWTWFGARMVHALVNYGMMEEAYGILVPMLERVIENQGFNEWYTPAGEPMGSGTFRGEAGVLYTAIELLRK